jgi:hypothetical protein
MAVHVMGESGPASTNTAMLKATARPYCFGEPPAPAPARLVTL